MISAEKEFLETARNIGKRLCQKAFWYNSQCNWVERSIDDIVIARDGSVVSKALSSEIYEGTSGIALFLSNLYSFDDRKDPEFKITAEAAISQALDRAQDIPPESRFGFYSGQTGIAYVAAEVGRNLSNPDLIEGALKLVRRLYKDDGSNYNLLDMISGIAGAIPSLIKIHQISNEPSILDLAMNLGDKLLSSAVKEPYGCSWDYKASGLQSAMHNLTGFSHGAAGIGYALIELYNVVEKKEYLEAARGAFQYEDHWFSQKDDNWPDFRLDEGDTYNTTTAQKMNKEPRFVAGWCHGAPGISISRLRANQILGEELYSSDIESAIRTMKRIVAGVDKNTDYPNFSLCHGLSGVGDILLYASDVLGSDSLKSLASSIGQYGIKEFAHKNLPWPCDNRVGEMLSLMLGIAGIGNFYLRLASSKHIPSPLIPGA